MVWFLFLAPILFAQSAGRGPAPEQAKRGEAVFFDAKNQTACNVCHAMAGKGTAVGPDLTRLARLNPRAIVMAIKSSRTQYVVALKPKTGKEFPAMKVEQQGDGSGYYDLSTLPPTMRKLPADEIASSRDNSAWKHPPESADYTSEQLADVIAYIRWVAYGDKAGVKVSDVD